MYEAHRRVHVGERPEAALLSRYRDRGLRVSVLRLFGTELVVGGTLQVDGGALVVANHQSALDIGVMLALSRGVLVSRHDVADWPLLGRLAKHGNTIFVDRDDRRSGVTALRAIRRSVKAGNMVVAFPEGGTFPGDSVHPFHPGTFAAVGSLGIPIIPVGLAYSPAVHYGSETFAEHMSKVAARRTTRIAVEFGAPLATEPDARSMAEAARSEVERLVVRGRAALDALETPEIQRLGRVVACFW